MVSSRHLVSGCVYLAALTGLDAFSPARSHSADITRSPSSLHMGPPKGCAAKPFEKKKIVVFGAGGYLGTTVFGFLQRAASLYGTGIAGISSPRAICATGPSSGQANKVLGTAFKLAFMGEDLIRLVDTSDVDHIKDRVKSFDAAVLGTTYQLERRTVTLNTYEKTPNSKTFEFYLDEKYGAWENDVPENDSDIHTSMFRNSVKACVEAGLSHLVVLETPRTVNPMEFLNILDSEDITYTYIRTGSPLTKDKSYSFEKGITNKLGVVRQPAGSSLTTFERLENEPAIFREDLAALIVQSLMTLDWGESRVLEVSHTPGSSIYTEYGAKRSKAKFDKEWCPNSGLLAEVLSAL